MGERSPDRNDGNVKPLPSAYQIMAADGAITIENGEVYITKAGVCAMTIAPPNTNGGTLRIISTTAEAHTLTAATIGFDAGNADNDVATWSGAIGDTLVLSPYNGEWYVVSQDGVALEADI